jgi:hypothetical protein
MKFQEKVEDFALEGRKRGIVGCFHWEIEKISWWESITITTGGVGSVPLPVAGGRPESPLLFGALRGAKHFR